MIRRIQIAVLLVFIGLSAAAQNYKPKTFEGDPYKVHFYTLENGLTVALSVNKTAPQIQTMIAVRTGSKNDPPDNTGLAHYLEHMLFKGSENYGTKSYAGEKYYLEKIESLYKLYGQTKDTVQRAVLYNLIDSLSYQASKIAIANEYDRMMQSIGATGTNAFTSTDQTVYINNIPANQLEKWLKIEYDRFDKPVFRLFHTELEAVYEEKNIGLDDDNEKAYDKLMEGIFSIHPYGLQTTIGTVDHLKNPSIEAIKKYYNTYYNPLNMALIMSGDFDPDETIKLIDKYLGAWKNKTGAKTGTGFSIPDSVEQEAFNQPVKEFTVVGPKEEKVFMGFRTKGAGTDDALLLYMADMILANSQAGLLDIDLNKAQKVQYASCSPLVMNDYSMHYFIAFPKEGQSLQECRSLIWEELEKLKRGEFDKSILQAIVDNMRLERAKSFDNNRSRCMNLMEAFIDEYSWEFYINMPERLEKLTAQDVMDFAKRTYINERHATVYKVMGKDTTIQKIPKPKITPIETNREAKSVFARKIEQEQVVDIQPVFPNFKEEIQETTYGKGKKQVTLAYNKNNSTDYFYLHIRFDMGTNNNPMLQQFADYMPYIATTNKTNEQISRELFNLACDFGFKVGDERSYIYLTGLNKNFDKAYALLTEIFTQAKVEQDKWESLVNDILKNRVDAKTNKGVILQQAMKNYARYGSSKNPFTRIVSEKELKKTKATEVQKLINGLLSCKYNVLYFGPEAKPQLEEKISTLIKPEHKLKNHPRAKKYKPKSYSKPVIYYVPYDMVQAEVIWERPLKKFDIEQIPSAAVFNEYFGTGMFSLVFQTIRESKALAYTAYAYIGTPSEEDKPAYAVAYIGTQADKLTNAIKGLNQLMDSIPNDVFMGSEAKESTRKRIAAERVKPEDMLFEEIRSERLGLEQPLNQYIYTNLDQVTPEKLQALQKQAFADKAFAICIIGAKDRIDLEALKQFGKVKKLTLEEIFGY